MVLEYPVHPLGQWLAQNLPVLAIVLLVLLGVGLLAGFVIAAQRAGPAAAFVSVSRSLYAALRDLRDLSLRRVAAMSRLAFKESLRSYVLVVLAVFIFILMFAGWFLDERADNPTRLYISFVLKLSGFLTVLMAIFLSAFSIPNDLKNKTIFTVVTKPVRAWELVLGRIAGFGIIGTLILAVMGLFSYVWVVRAIGHTHAVTSNDVQRDTDLGVTTGRTTFNRGHRHEFIVDGNQGETLGIKGHFHDVDVTDSDPPAFDLGSPQGALEARVAVYGDLRFLDRNGRPAVQGINVGKEWTYRGYVEGATQSAGVFRFANLQSRDFRDALPLEMTIRVFRTYKGDIERGIRGSMVLRNPALNNPVAWEAAKRNPDVAKESEPIAFFASDMTPESMKLDRKIVARMADDNLREVDIFESLVNNGELEIVIRCEERAQYYGMARTDMYLRAADKLFVVNFVKTYFTLWLRMMIVIAMGVMFSTVLSGPVAMLATTAMIVLGFFAKFITDLAQGILPGGGPVESLIRNVRQDNMITELELNSIARVTIELIDSVSLLLLRGVSSLMPNFGDFSERGGIETSRFVAYGFDVPWALTLQHFIAAVMYIAICTCIGYFLLKSKEVAA